MATRSELKPGQVWRDAQGDLLRLDRRVPGDGSLWSCDVWYSGSSSWSCEEYHAEPSDLVERLPEREAA